jgi:hypothetical protein
MHPGSAPRRQTPTLGREYPWSSFLLLALAPVCLGGGPFFLARTLGAGFLGGTLRCAFCLSALSRPDFPWRMPNPAQSSTNPAPRKEKEKSGATFYPCFSLYDRPAPSVKPPRAGRAGFSSQIRTNMHINAQWGKRRQTPPPLFISQRQHAASVRILFGFSRRRACPSASLLLQQLFCVHHREAGACAGVLPTAAKGHAHADDAIKSVAQRCRQPQFGSKKLTLGVQHRQVVRIAVVVLAGQQSGRHAAGFQPAPACCSRCGRPHAAMSAPCGCSSKAVCTVLRYTADGCLFLGFGILEVIPVAAQNPARAPYRLRHSSMYQRGR